MSIPPQLRVLFFDVYGTCVAQRKPVADELWNATQEVLKEDGSSINAEVRKKAEETTYEQYFDLGGEWNAQSDKFVKHTISTTKTINWTTVDEQRISLLPQLLSSHGLILLNPDNTPKPGTLFTSSELAHLGRVWHRLPPHPDTLPGLHLLNTRYTTATLSNTSSSIISSLVSHSALPFQHIFSSSMFDSYKPNPKVYLSASGKLGVKPEECALVAAHLGDLKAAKECGFYAIYVERWLEEKAAELEGEGIPDLVVGEEEEGFVALAGRLGGF